MQIVECAMFIQLPKAVLGEISEISIAYRDAAAMYNRNSYYYQLVVQMYLILYI